MEKSAQSLQCMRILSERHFSVTLITKQDHTHTRTHTHIHLKAKKKFLIIVGNL